MLGTRDYLTKNGFTDAVVGLSGGIDSSLVATVAVDAIGSLIQKGEIVAIKGLGGYHLACDATKGDVVARLRQLKRLGDPLDVSGNVCSRIGLASDLG